MNGSVQELTELIETRQSMTRMINKEKENGSFDAMMDKIGTVGARHGIEMPQGLKIMCRVSKKIHTSNMAILEEEMKELEVAIASLEDVFSKNKNEGEAQ